MVDDLASSEPELNVSRNDWDSTRVFECLGLAVSQSRNEEILALKEFLGL